MRLRPAPVALLIAVAGAASLAVPAVRADLAALGHALAPPASTVDRSSPRPGPGLNLADQQPPPPPTLRYAPVAVDDPTVFLGWSLADRSDPATPPVVAGSRNFQTGTSTAGSMIAPWIVADYLRLHPAAPERVRQELASAIATGDDRVTQKYYLLGGADAVVQRLVTTCGLRHTAVAHGSWAETTMTPQDAAVYGLCLADGRAAGPQWTQWLLDAMARVTGVRRAGIVDGLPAVLAGQASVANGASFATADHLWRVNCLAILHRSVLAVMLRYAGPDDLTGSTTGSRICASIAGQLVYTPEI